MIVIQLQINHNKKKTYKSLKQHQRVQMSQAYKTVMMKEVFQLYTLQKNTKLETHLGPQKF